MIGAALILVLQNASTHTIVQRGTLGYLAVLRRPRHRRQRQRIVVGSLRLRTGGDPDDQGAPARRRRRRHVPHAGRTISARPPARSFRARTTPRRGGAITSPSSGSWPSFRWCGGASCLAICCSARSGRRSAGRRHVAWRAVAFFVASLFGVPSQSIAITLTFWVFVFWFLIEQRRTGRSGNRSEGVASTADDRGVALIAIHAGTTVIDAFGDLRPRHRVERFDWYYRYGLGVARRRRARSGRQSGRPPLDDEGFAGGDSGQRQSAEVRGVDRSSGQRRQAGAHAGLGRLTAGLRGRSEARAAVPRYSRDARQDAHGVRDVDRSHCGARASTAAATGASWACRFATGSGNSRSSDSDFGSRIISWIVLSRYARIVS